MWLTVLALAGTGIIAGMFGAMLGLGEGILLVPALALLFGLLMRVADGVSLIGIIVTSSGVATVARPGRSRRCWPGAAPGDRQHTRGVVGQPGRGSVEL